MDELITCWKDRAKRQDELVARVCWAIHHAQTTPRKEDGTGFTPEDFVPRPPPSPELQEALLQAKMIVMAARSGKVG